MKTLLMDDVAVLTVTAGPADDAVTHDAVFARVQFLPKLIGYLARITVLQDILAFSIRILELTDGRSISWRRGGGKGRGGQYKQRGGGGDDVFHGSYRVRVLLPDVNRQIAINTGER